MATRIPTPGTALAVTPNRFVEGHGFSRAVSFPKAAGLQPLRVVGGQLRWNEIPKFAPEGRPTIARRF